MAKTKTPFLSLRSRGTIADVLTTQRRAQATLIRGKPIPTDPQSIYQLSQRAHYLACLSWWNTLTTTQKLLWQTAARRYHMAGMPRYLKHYLPTPSNPAARYHLEERSGLVAADSSINGRHGTIGGALHQEALYGYGLWFDNVDDVVDCGTGGSLDLGQAFTISVWFKRQTDNTTDCVLGRLMGLNWAYAIRALNDQRIYLNINQNGADVGHFCTALAIAGAWVHILFTFDGAALTAYINNIYDSSRGGLAPTILYDSNHLYLGDRQIPPANQFHGLIDEVHLFPRVLDTPDRNLLYERRTPS